MGRDPDRHAAVAGAVERLEQLDEEPDQRGREQQREHRQDPPAPPVFAARSGRALRRLALARDLSPLAPVDATRARRDLVLAGVNVVVVDVVIVSALIVDVVIVSALIVDVVIVSVLIVDVVVVEVLVVVAVDFRLHGRTRRAGVGGRKLRLGLGGPDPAVRRRSRSSRAASRSAASARCRQSRAAPEAASQLSSRCAAARESSLARPPAPLSEARREPLVVELNRDGQLLEGAARRTRASLRLRGVAAGQRQRQPDDHPLHAELGDVAPAAAPSPRRTRVGDRLDRSGQTPVGSLTAHPQPSAAVVEREHAHQR